MATHYHAGRGSRFPRMVVVPPRIRVANAQSDDLVAASKRGDLPVVNAMMSQADVNVDAKRRETGDTALLLASENGHLRVVQALLALKANVNATRNGGRALLEAIDDDVREDHLEVVQALLEAGRM